MKLLQSLSITSNIRTHAVIVGILFVLVAIYFTYESAIFYQNEVVQLPEKEALLNTFLKYLLLVTGILDILFPIVYWIGFLMRKRWCLSVIFRILGVSIPLQILEILRTFISGNITGDIREVAFLLITFYVFSVVRHLRAVYLEEELTNRQNDAQCQNISLQSLKGVQKFMQV